MYFIQRIWKKEKFKEMIRLKDDYISAIINDFSDSIGDMIVNLEDNIQNAISENEDYLDIENFIFELKKNNLYTKELEDFIARLKNEMKEFK